MPVSRLVAILALSTTTHEAQSSDPAPPEWQRWSSRTHDGRPIEGQIARLRVPENRAAPTRSITLAVIRLPGTGPRPGNPTVFLMGGPGIPASVMLPIPPYFDLFTRLRAGGDVVLLDQRGIGLSEPTLNCPAREPLPADFLATRARALAELKAVTSLCLAEWKERGVDVLAFNTAESAEDLEALRQALGGPRLNLLAFSYGTHLALSYARRHPDGVGRMVLQGVRGPDQSLKSPLVYDRGFRRLAALAGRDPVAAALTPDMAATLSTLLERLESSPLKVTVTDRSGTPSTLTMGKEGLQLLVSNAPDDPRLPAMLSTLEQGDSRLLGTMAASARQGLAEVNLMARAVDCASASSAEARERVARERGSALLGDPAPNLARSAAFCELFGDIALPDEFRSPVASGAPTLFLSGELDVLAPPEDAAAVAARFPRSVQLVVRNGRHELLPIPAVREVVVDFLAGKDVAGRELVADPPRWLSVEQAKAPPRRR